MATISDQLPRMVDDVLEPVWRKERSRARRRGVYVRVGQVVAGALLFLVIAVAVDLLVGVTVPWVAFTCISLVAMAFSVGGQPDPFD